ncbi:MAG TPA: transporter, partial [Archangium sp.]|nr:transporter [Archangium sp.]
MRTRSQRVMGVGVALVATLAGAQVAPAPTPSPAVPTPTAPGAPDVAPQVTEPVEQAVPEQGPPNAPGEGKREPLTLEELVRRARKQDARVEAAQAELRRLQALL